MPDILDNTSGQATEEDRVYVCENEEEEEEEHQLPSYRLDRLQLGTAEGTVIRI